LKNQGLRTITLVLWDGCVINFLIDAFCGFAKTMLPRWSRSSAQNVTSMQLSELFVAFRNGCVRWKNLSSSSLKMNTIKHSQVFAVA
jgi:hypothetical protein